MNYPNILLRLQMERWLVYHKGVLGSVYLVLGMKVRLKHITLTARTVTQSDGWTQKGLWNGCNSKLNKLNMKETSYDQ